MSSSIHNKTIRPGSLKGYAYYYGGRRPAPLKPARQAKPGGRKGFLVVALLVVLAGFWLGAKGASDKPPASSAQPSQSQAAAAAKAPATNHCAGNTLDHLIKISIEQRHLWACAGGQMAYDAPIITGLRHHPETETPLGTYKIYGKTTNTTLTGTDSRGTWKDPVYYWMPFLDNQYGTYGFHDATWRADSAFGNISPDSEEASHGCIELKLSDSKWLYEWSPAGTTVTVEA